MKTNVAVRSDWMRAAAGASLAALLVAVAVPAMAQKKPHEHGGGASLEAKIEAASTPADHEAIAAEYERLAAAAEADAVRHEQMKAAYGKGAMKGKYQVMQGHCQRIVDGSRARAAEFKALAEAHRAQAGDGSE